MIVLAVLLACAEPTTARSDRPEVAVPASTDPTTTLPSDSTASAPPCIPVPGERRLRRLTHAEYGATVRDLLDTDLAPEAGLVDDDAGDDPLGDVHLEVGALLADQYLHAAELLAADALPRLDALLPPCAARDEACVERFVDAFGRRAWRRPLTGPERARQVAVWAAVADEEGFDEGMRWLLVSLLTAPQFLYRVEGSLEDAAGGYSLTDHEVATALSYGILGTTPDDALLDAAADGTLATDGGVAATVDALVADPRAAERLFAVVSRLLELDTLSVVVRGDALTADVRVSLEEEARRLVVAQVRAGGSLEDLLMARESEIDALLAGFYGVAPPATTDADGFGAVIWSRRAGLLDRGAFLAVHAVPDGSSPVRRGVAVREFLLCQPLPIPPAELQVALGPVDPTLTTRQRFEAHTTDPACAGCHTLIDPIGFAFEHFDGVGRWRDTERGLPVDTSTELDGVPVGGSIDLADALAASPVLQPCWVEHALTAFGGAAPTACELEAALSAGGADQLTEVWRTWATSPAFRHRR
ncbi:MAG: hypothetical protein ACI8PZ_001077 [Myxococcota bacterium]|jgi:hypothetical protein